MQSIGNNKFQHLPQGHHFLSRQRLLDTSGSNDLPKNYQYKAECYRFMIMFLLFVVNIAVQCLWISFAPISNQAANYYSVNETFINTLSIIYMILYIPGTIFAGWIVGKIGLYWSFLLACILMSAQGLMRVLSIGDEYKDRKHGEILLMASQVIGAMTQPLVLNSTPQVATIWFPASQRDIAIAVGNSFMILGIGAGEALPAIFVDADGSGMTMLLKTTAIIPCVCTVLFFFLFREKPEQPPSYSAAVLRNVERSMSDFTRLLKFRQMQLLIVAFGLGLALFNAMTTLVAQIVRRDGFNSDDASNFGTAFAVAGLVSVFIIGPLMDIFHRYVMFMRVCVTFLVVATVGMLVALEQDHNFMFVCGSWILMGLSVIPCLPLSVEIGAEIGYPVHEDVPTGLLMGAGNVTAIPFIYFLGYLIKLQTDECTWLSCYAQVVTVAVSVVIWLLSLFFKPEYKRRDAELKREALIGGRVGMPLDHSETVTVTS